VKESYYKYYLVDNKYSLLSKSITIFKNEVMLYDLSMLTILTFLNREYIPS
jgi:hypothetical protein